MAGENERPMITVSVEGVDKQVPLPDGYLPASEVGEKYTANAVVDQQRKDFETSLRGRLSAELINSDDFLKRVAELKKDKLVPMLGIKQKDDGDNDKLLDQFRQKEVTPLTEQITALGEEVSTLRTRAFEADANEACDAAGVRDELKTLVKPWLNQQVKWSDAHKAYVAFDDKDEVRYTVGENGRTRPMTATDLLVEVEKSGKAKDWFKPKVRDGAGFTGTGKSGTRSVTLDQFEKMGDGERSALNKENPELYLELLQARADSGWNKLKR